MTCPFGNERCLCQTCAHRIDGKACRGRMCQECDFSGGQEPDRWMCSSYMREDDGEETEGKPEGGGER